MSHWKVVAAARQMNTSNQEEYQWNKCSLRRVHGREVRMCVFQGQEEVKDCKSCRVTVSVATTNCPSKLDIREPTSSLIGLKDRAGEVSVNSLTKDLLPLIYEEVTSGVTCFPVYMNLSRELQTQNKKWCYFSWAASSFTTKGSSNYSPEWYTRENFLPEFDAPTFFLPECNVVIIASTYREGFVCRSRKSIPATRSWLCLVWRNEGVFVSAELIQKKSNPQVRLMTCNSLYYLEGRGEDGGGSGEGQSGSLFL